MDEGRQIVEQHVADAAADHYAERDIEQQIGKLVGRIKVKGVTLVPLRLYFNKRGLAKVMLGLAKGRKEYEKRDVIKKRDWERDKARIIRGTN